MFLIEGIIYSVIFIAVAFLIDFKYAQWSQKREMVIYICAVSVAFVIIVLHSFNVDLPSPSLILINILGGK